MLNTILLAVLDLFAIFYLVQALLPETKKSFYKREVSRLNRQIWAEEFKVEKTRQIREQIRQDRDRLVDARHKIEVEFKATPNDKKLEKEFTEVTDTIKRYEAQMVMLDKEINGVPADKDNAGQQGLLEIISSMAEVRRMYQERIANM